MGYIVYNDNCYVGTVFEAVQWRQATFILTKD